MCWKSSPTMRDMSESSASSKRARKRSTGERPEDGCDRSTTLLGVGLCGTCVRVNARDDTLGAREGSFLARVRLRTFAADRRASS